MRAPVRKKLTVAGAAVTAVAIPALFALIGGPVSASPGQSVTSLNGTTKEVLATTLANGHGTVSNVTFTGQPEQAGLFSGFGPIFGINSGVVLSTGAAAFADEGAGEGGTGEPEPTETDPTDPAATDGESSSPAPTVTVTTTISALPESAPVPGIRGGGAEAAGIEGPADSDGGSTGFGLPGDADLTADFGAPTYDAAVLEFDFVPTVAQFTIQYVYTSHEYIDTENGEPSAAQPLAVLPEEADPTALYYDGTLCSPFADDAVVSGANINSDLNAEWFVDNTAGAYDTAVAGFSRVLTCTLNGTPGVPVHLKLVIADGGDDIVDSSVLFAPFNAPPVVSDYTATGKGEPITFPLAATDSDGDPITYTLASLPANGTAVVSGASIIYTPKAGYVGTDSFTYTGADQFGTSNIGTITVVTEGLAATGASPAPHLALGLALVLAGAGAVALGRRRQQV